MGSPRRAEQRAWMVAQDVAGRGITDERVLGAMGTVPREQFVPESMVQFAYDDSPLPIEEGQTISQPYIVALMAEAAELTRSSRVLEVGTGSGYGAAILGQLAGRVWSIERHQLLASKARQRLKNLGYDNVEVIHGDGNQGLPDFAPFDSIVVTAGSPVIPKPLIEQLVDGGRLIIPVGSLSRGQHLLRIHKRGDALVEENLGAVRFVPLI